MVKFECSYIAGQNIKWYDHFGNILTVPLKHQSPTCLAPGTGVMIDNLSMAGSGGGAGRGGTGRDGVGGGGDGFRMTQAHYIY